MPVGVVPDLGINNNQSTLNASCAGADLTGVKCWPKMESATDTDQNGPAPCVPFFLLVISYNKASGATKTHS